MSEDFLTQTYRLYAREVYLYAFSLAKDAALAEELTAETFYKACLALDQERTEIKYWLFRVCKNCFYDHCRKSRHQAVEPLAEREPAVPEQALAGLLADEARRQLYGNLLHLPPAARELLFLFYFSGQSIQEIARLSGKTPGAVKTALSRARGQLRQLLQADNQACDEEEQG